MKRNVLFSLILLLTAMLPATLSAKKVKFSVNLNGIAANVTGVHIVGDFQTLAGFPGGDWNSATTPMWQEPSDTNIYSIVVDLPAFAKYEFKFANGDQFYEVEFVPVESRVGYNFNDSRWIYLDSLAPDTTLVGPIVFSGNAPAGYRLMRFLVDMHEEASVSPLGVHVAGTFQGWDPMSMHMYSFVPGIWEHIGYLDSMVASTEFLYYNGNSLTDAEMVMGSCTSNMQRVLTVPKDTVLPAVCFGSCAACLTVSNSIAWQPRLEVYPNPAQSGAMVRLSNHFGNWTLHLRDQQGKLLETIVGTGEQAVRLERNGRVAGMYFVTVTDASGSTATQKLIFQ